MPAIENSIIAMAKHTHTNRADGHPRRHASYLYYLLRKCPAQSGVNWFLKGVWSKHCALNVEHELENALREFMEWQRWKIDWTDPAV